MFNGCIYHSRKPHPSGYVRVENPRGGTTGAHRLAYEFKYGEIPCGLIVCHKCDNPACINTDHLFLGTNQDNSNDMVSKGRSLYGEKNPKNKLTEADVMNIRRSFYDGENVNSLAVRYETSSAFIYRITEGKVWKHLPVLNKQGGSKLNPDKAIEIRKLSALGVTGVELSKIFNVSRATVSRVINGLTLAGGVS